MFNYNFDIFFLVFTLLKILLFILMGMVNFLINNGSFRN